MSVSDVVLYVSSEVISDLVGADETEFTVWTDKTF